MAGPDRSGARRLSGSDTGAVAEVVAGEGAQVALFDVRDDLGEAVAKDIGGDAAYVHCDVSSETDWEAAVRNGITQEQFVEKVRAEVRALGAPPTFVEVLPLAETYEGLKLYCEQVPA